MIVRGIGILPILPSRSAGSRCHVLQRLDLHAFELFKWQVFKQCAPRASEVMLHWIVKGEEITSGIFESVTQCDEFFPAIDRDQPAVLETALKLFGFDA